MDIFAMSSDTEQMPNTLIQAMAAGRPVAAVDVGDVRANLSPENRRFVVPREDEAGFAAAIGSLLSDPALRAALSVANLAHVNAHYTHDRMFAAYGEAFEATLASARINR
jgi:glycosyltransferase involved in cell wall biosynthesis